jgi:hypothetical protein
VTSLQLERAVRPIKIIMQNTCIDIVRTFTKDALKHLRNTQPVTQETLRDVYLCALVELESQHTTRPKHALLADKGGGKHVSW